MDLRFSCLFLVAGLFLSSSAEITEECGELTKPLTINSSEMVGTWTFITGYTHLKIFNDILEITQSSRVNVSLADDGSENLIMEQENRINGTCIGSKATVSVDGNIARTQMANVTSEFQLLSTCEGCLVFSINSTSQDMSKLLKALKVNSPPDGPINANAIYLMCKETTVKDSDLEHFKKQASCFGFMGEPKFTYDPKDGFCEEGEVRHLKDILKH